MDDGFSTTVELANVPDLKIYERELTIEGAAGEGPVNTSTMRNSALRTSAPKKLATFRPVTATVAFATSVWPLVVGQVQVNQLITIHFPDTTLFSFYGWIEQFNIRKVVPGEQVTADIVLQPSLRDLDGVETAPGVPPPPTVDLGVTLEAIGSQFATKTGVLRATVVGDLSTTASLVVLEIVLDPGMDFVSADVEPTTNVGGVLVWVFPTFSAAVAQALNITVQYGIPGAYTVIANLSSLDQDTDLGNNTALLEQDLTLPPVDLSIVLEAVGETFTGENFLLRGTYDVGNLQTAENVVLVVTLPASFTIMSALSPVPASIVGNVVTYTFLSLAAATVGLVEIVVRPTEMGDFTTQAVIASSSNLEVEESNNTAILDQTLDWRDKNDLDVWQYGAPVVMPGNGPDFDAWQYGAPVIN